MYYPYMDRYGPDKNHWFGYFGDKEIGSIFLEFLTTLGLALTGLAADGEFGDRCPDFIQTKPNYPALPISPQCGPKLLIS